MTEEEKERSSGEPDDAPEGPTQAGRSMADLGVGIPRSRRIRPLQSMKTIADEMMYLSEKLNASALYINKLLEVLLLSPEEYTELTRAGVIDRPLTDAGSERRSSPDIAQLLQLAQGADLDPLAKELLSRLQKDS
ncbi:MAG: hypothetical protein R6U70_07360 [Bacillota bacterium]